jgi:predicted nucleotidyltransferase
MKYITLLEKSLKEKKEIKEKTRYKILHNIKIILKNMQNVIPFKQAYIFGSITKSNDFNEKSDIDIAFLGLPKERLFETIAYLSRKLLKDVDVIELERSPLKEKILKEGINWKKL